MPEGDDARWHERVIGRKEPGVRVAVSCALVQRVRMTVRQTGEATSGFDKLAEFVRQNTLGPSAVFHVIMNKSRTEFLSADPHLSESGTSR